MFKATIAAALLPAAVLLIAPAAGADPTGTKWAAIAYSTTTGKSHVSVDKDSQQEADDDAVAKCNDLAGDPKELAKDPTNMCHVEISSHYCVSLATDPDPTHNAVLASGQGQSLEAADDEAMQNHPDWTIAAHGCNMI
jgi:hypothetical protein